ncbi:MAG: GAF domain-containing protein [Balneolaceae bacterium]|nr:GAF domain-containing protein [Balneolaceae bacterium]
MSTTTVENKEKIIEKVDDILSRPVSRDEKLFAICELLDDEVEVFDWVGFYLVDPDADRELVLGPYVGEPTDHTRIPFGRGICGQAAESLETYVVQDVSKEDNYLACSVDVKAEIVVPILKEGKLLGELDIDSHSKDSITPDHRNMLEEIAEKVAGEF